MIHVEKAVVGMFEVNCYVLWGSESNALVVDPGGDPDSIGAILAQHRLRVCAYLLTHGHVDHVAALEVLYGAHPAPIGINPADASWVFSESNLFPPFYPAPRQPAAIERLLTDGQTWMDSGLEYRVLGTPGHTPGSICLYFEQEKTLLSGDTLFQGSVGRTDLPEGDSRELARSLKKLAALSDDTTVYPGHGPATTIAAEKRSNYFIQSACQALRKPPDRRYVKG